MTTIYYLHSTPLLHIPGLIAWLREVYQVNPGFAVEVALTGFPEIPLPYLTALLSGEVAYTVEGGDTVVFESPACVKQQEIC